MPVRAFNDTDSRAGVACEAEFEINGQSLTLRLNGREGVFAVSEYCKTFDFERAYFNRRIGRLIQRIASRERCRSLETRKWPCRPFRWMKKDCRFLGTLRGSATFRPSRENHPKRLFSMALVPRKGVSVIEVCIDDADWSTVHLPVTFFAQLGSLLSTWTTEGLADRVNSPLFS